MAAEALDDAEAARICRTPKPSPGAAKAVLQWASSAPGPDKAPCLLLLQTDNYLSRKALAAGFTEALAACAAVDPSPLWKTIEGDWDTYRVLHAIRAVAYLKDKAQMERLIGLGAKPYLRIHWSAIEDAAAKMGTAIPEEILLAQAALEAQRGAADFQALFLGRKSSWPEQADLDRTTSAANPVAQKLGGAMPAAGKPGKAAAGKTGESSAPPAFLDPQAELHPFLKSRKQALAKKWSIKAMDPLFDAVDLAFYLTALGREAEAAEICDFLAANVAFTGDQNVWTPVGYGICLRARLLRRSENADAATAALAPIIAHPFNRKPSPAQIGKKLEAIPGALESAAAETGKKASCQDFARALYILCFHLEQAAAIVPGYTDYAVEPLEDLWRRGLAMLSARLDS